jgi:ubiquinone/menaquinone biosynthesis C-methylase UbiE
LIGEKMLSWYEKNYWRTGFKSRLYDRLTPESYFESMRRVVSLLSGKRDLKIWDAGCGSGLLLVFLGDAFRNGCVYYGTDLLSAGLDRVKQRAHELGILDRVTCFQNDLSESPPLKENSIDIVISHFSIYTILDYDKRQEALKNIYHVLKPGGLFIASCPSKNYDADQIIKESYDLIRIKKGFWNAILKRLFVYPLTKRLGLNFIQYQLESGKWMAYTLEDLAGELRQVGFEVGASQTVYASSAYLICGHKLR